MNCDSIGIAQIGYGLDDRGSVPGGSNDGIFFIFSITGGSLPGDKAARA
jgi:hypothetical protein